MPLDTIYLTRHGVCNSKLPEPRPRFKTPILSTSLTATPPAPPQLDDRLQHRRIQSPVPNSNREPRRPNPNLPWRPTIARIGRAHRKPRVPAQAVPRVLQPLLPLSTDDPANRRGAKGKATAATAAAARGK